LKRNRVRRRPDDVLLAFRSHRTFLARSLPAVVADKGIVGDRFGTDESALEVGVYDAGSLGRGVAAMNCPGPNFLLSSREVGLEAEQLVAGANQPVETRRSSPAR
jgi:hypothetical protein